MAEMREIHIPAGLFGPQPEMDPATEAHLQKVAEAVMKHEQEARRQVLFFAPVLCSCRMYYLWEGDQSPPQSSCIIHHGAMMTPEGKMIG